MTNRKASQQNEKLSYDYYWYFIVYLCPDYVAFNCNGSDLIMVINAKYVNWFDEGLESFYGDDNQGFIHGFYVYDETEDFPYHVEWFKTEEEARKALLTI